MNQSELKLVRAAARIAQTAPESWQQFLEAVFEFSTAQTTSCIQSPIEHLPVAQGRAQIAARIAALLADCNNLADKSEGTRNGR